MEDEDIKLNPTKNIIKGKIILDRDDNKIPYYTLLKMIKNNEIERNGLQFIDNKYKMWVWDADTTGFINVNTDDRYDNYIHYLTDDERNTLLFLTGGLRVIDSREISKEELWNLREFFGWNSRPELKLLRVIIKKDCVITKLSR